LRPGYCRGFTKINIMLHGTYYLNNSGSRWVCYTKGKKDKITLYTQSGKEITRTVIYYESFGNFGSAAINYKGKILKVLADSTLVD
jgi:hypothetical protein